jgi:septal ring factor EnvC (AmiA/AmiB activator)
MVTVTIASQGARARRFLSLFTRHLSLLVLAAASVVFAQTSSPEEQRQSDLSKIRARIGELRSRLAESRKNVATLSEEIKRLDWKIEIGEHETELLSARRGDLAYQLTATGTEREAAAAASGRFARALVTRARVLHRLGRYGYFRVLLEARDATGFLQGVERLDELARRDGTLLASYRSAQARLERDLAREESLKKEMDEVLLRSRRELANMGSLRRNREGLLAQERSVSASQKSEVIALSDKAERLERLLATLAQQSRQEPADASGGIRPWKGVLDWPARGALTETFGRHRHPKFDAWTISNGIAIAQSAGTPVRAVYSGRAVYAQWLAEYGNLVILDHGDGVMTLYAWLQSVAVAAGSYVPAGSTIGAVGTGPGLAEPGLYFEVRDRQRASDPVAWLR